MSTTLAGPTFLLEEVGDGLFFVAASPAMHRLRALVGRVASVDASVLCLGDSGTGKEIIARLIHKMSRRAGRTFLKVNCAALPGELLESELFGYEPGAFTGATRSKPGKFEQCNHGTLLLDEIAEMPSPLQAKLLQVLQDGEFSRLGGRRTIKVDVRILAATNVGIQQAIREKRFREDLYYRLGAFVFHLPPLCERREDIPVLLRHFLGQYSAAYRMPNPDLSPSLWESCLQYDWPGNVRELQNFAKSYLVLGADSPMLKQFSKAAAKRAPVLELMPEPRSAPNLKKLVRGLKDEAERKAIRAALEQTRWNRKEAARSLDISYKALLYKIRQYRLDEPSTPVPDELVGVQAIAG